MERLIFKQLQEWQASPARQPLLLLGPCQVGKTFVLQEFGRRCYNSIAYFTFADHPEYLRFFRSGQSAQRLLLNLIMASGQRITPDQTLIIFDDLHGCADLVLSYLPLFHNSPYHISCILSPLDFSTVSTSALADLKLLKLQPCSFSEFLEAQGEQSLVEALHPETLTPLAEDTSQHLWGSSRLRFSLDPLSLDQQILNIPLYMADQTAYLLDLALAQRQD